jgi:hypothetical protein
MDAIRIHSDRFELPGVWRGRGSEAYYIPAGGGYIVPAGIAFFPKLSHPLEVAILPDA